MKKILILVALMILTVQFLQAQTLVTGLPDDGQIHLPPSYNSFLPPPLGVTFTDPAYGTKIYRMTDGVAQFNDAVHHEYATMSPFNKNNTLVLLLNNTFGFYVTDRFGEIIYPPQTLGIGGDAEPRWSPKFQDNFYYHQGNQLLVFDTSTGQSRTLRTFSQFNSITFGGGESDISEDGDHFVIVGDGTFAGVYTLSTDQLGRLLDFDYEDFDYFDVTPNNNVIVRWGNPGTERFQGIETFDSQMNFIRQVVPFAAHADRSHDLNNDEILILLASNDPDPAPGCENNGIEKIRLSDSQKTCILPLDYDSEVHISSNRFKNGSNPWVLVSTTDNRNNTAAPFNALPADWQSRWGLKYNELILVKLDGSQVIRLAHHRSRELDDYWFLPRAAISRDGAFAIFDSNFGQSPFYYYTDVYWINLTGNAYEVTAVPATTYSGTTLAPDSLASGFGTILTTITKAGQLPLATSLGGARVYLRDSKGKEYYSPLLYVSPTQVNFQVPSQMAMGAATITVLSNEGSASMGKVNITNVKPGLFSADSTGKGLAAATVQRVKADLSQSIEPVVRFDPAQGKIVAVPIDLGATTDQVFLNLFGTGIRHRSSLAAVKATIGGVNAQVLYADDQNYFSGVDQVNVLIPRTLTGRGLVDVVLTVDGQISNIVNVRIQ
jgi:uncharacterized protein (TIGR03437 family)